MLKKNATRKRSMENDEHRPAKVKRNRQHQQDGPTRGEMDSAAVKPVVEEPVVEPVANELPTAYLGPEADAPPATVEAGNKVGSHAADAQTAIQPTAAAELGSPQRLADSPAVSQKLLESLIQEVEHYILDRKMSPADALKAVREAGPIHLQQMTQGGLRDFAWPQLRVLQATNPALFSAVWSEMQELARKDIRSGEWGAGNIGMDSQTPYERAEYLALLKELSEEWQPRTGIERMLLEQLAQAHWLYSRWLKRMTSLSMLEDHEANQATTREAETDRSGKLPASPRLSGAQAVDRAFVMVDRFHKMVVRSQRALRDQRRYGINIVNAQQVNVGEQQVNVGEVFANDVASTEGRPKYIVDVVEQG